MLAYVSLSFRLLCCHLTGLIPSRVSIVDFRGNVILDTFVAPTMQVSDYRTTTTGIEACHLLACESVFNILLRPLNTVIYRYLISTDVADTPLFERVQQHVADLIKGKVIVGHSLWHDLSGRVHTLFVILATELIKR